MSQEDLLLVQAIAGVLLVLVTAVYAWRTHVVARQTSKLARATTDTAKSVRASAWPAARTDLQLIETGGPRAAASTTSSGTRARSSPRYRY